MSAASARTGAEEDRKRWLRLLLLLPPVLCALGGFIAGERLREQRQRSALERQADTETFADSRLVQLGRVALPLETGLAAMTLTATVDVALSDDDVAYATRRGDGRAEIKDAVILALADAMQVPGVQQNLSDSARIADLLARDLRRSRPDLAGVRLTGLQVVDAHGVSLDLTRPLPGS
ncbi:hypothetical protein [Frigidibacter sp. MR17.24]|uniref:hypothetical protein n=1 Tax=Frigidibacter sp. MR17.24 TaxID=3127345 RepID=UPI00301315E5